MRAVNFLRENDGTEIKKKRNEKLRDTFQNGTLKEITEKKYKLTHGPTVQTNTNAWKPLNSWTRLTPTSTHRPRANLTVADVVIVEMEILLWTFDELQIFSEGFRVKLTHFAARQDIIRRWWWWSHQNSLVSFWLYFFHSYYWSGSTKGKVADCFTSIISFVWHRSTCGTFKKQIRLTSNVTHAPSNSASP